MGLGLGFRVRASLDLFGVIRHDDAFIARDEFFDETKVSVVPVEVRGEVDVDQVRVTVLHLLSPVKVVSPALGLGQAGVIGLG